MPASGIHHFATFGNGQGERFFAVDVLAGFHGIDTDLRVPVIRCTADDYIDIVHGQYLAVISGGDHARVAELRLDFLQMRFLYIADAGRDYAGLPAEFTEVARTTMTHADASGDNLIIRRDASIQTKYR